VVEAELVGDRVDGRLAVPCRVHRLQYQDVLDLCVGLHGRLGDPAPTDKAASAEFLARLLGISAGPPVGPFIPVQINKDLTMDFDDRHGVQPGHYAFLVDEDTFDALLGYLGDNPAIDYGSGPVNGWDRRFNRLGAGRGVYIRDPDGHSYELFTAVPAG
jgi:catechol 2,3-dioxygenase-like lactoylglutathione lyase family enzyme